MSVEDLTAVDLLQRILDDALARDCTDVHLRGTGTEVTVDFRTAGLLVPFSHFHDPNQMVIRRVKALARMDVAESRLPQDGAFVWPAEAGPCDVRAATVPVVGGESVALRLLSRSARGTSLESLGIDAAAAAQIRSLLQEESGLLLVAGPTGSGKTTTLYAMMREVAATSRHVVSIEDPVEMELSQCRQMEVRERIGVTFEAGLRALLRLDPDVIMIGEVRDEVTARVAVRAALTGHLVLSTTHARDWMGQPVG